MDFPKKKFETFCESLLIESKEKGLTPLKFIGTQRYFLDEVCKGLKDDKHTFVILKGRQLGISTVSLALDLFWLFNNPGTQGSLVTNNDKALAYFRTVLTNYLKFLPNDWKIPTAESNQNQIAFENRSRLAYLVAGTRRSANSSLGRSQALSYLHSTETAFYGDEEGVESLYTTLAEKNPKRLYVFESTANGYNQFEQIWRTAKKSDSQEAIFIGWWRNEFYRCERGSKEFKRYGGKPRKREQEWMRDIKKLYDFDIQPEQLAWYRWKLEEFIHDDLMMQQEYPAHEFEAFVVTGSHFFSRPRLDEAYRLAIKLKPDVYNYNFGNYFEYTKLEANPNGELKIYEHPHPRGFYVLGASPAFAASNGANQYTIFVGRCYADRIEQVAEYAIDSLTTYRFAWVIAHLAGFYRNTVVNVEVSGAGMSVWQELMGLQRLVPYGGQAGQDINDFLGNVRYYTWRRPDSMGNGFAWHWKTSWDNKALAMNSCRDLFERGLFGVRSTDLLDEMAHIVDEQGETFGSARYSENLIMSAALACAAYLHNGVIDQLVAEFRTFEREERINRAKNVESVLERQVLQHLRMRVGI